MKRRRWRRTFKATSLLIILFVLTYTGLHDYIVLAVDSQEVIASYGEIKYPSVLVIQVLGGGSTVPVVGSHLYSEGSIVSVDAVSDLGWTLSHWLLDGSDVGAADPYSITMNSDHNLTAVFVETPESGMLVGVDYYSRLSSASFINRDLPFFEDAGIQIVRLEFGPNSLSNLASLVPTLKENGVQILGLLMNRALLNDVDAWGDWVYNVVNEYKSHIRHWEMWNEPNWNTGFGAPGDPMEYLPFLRTGYVRAKEADPNCVVILGGNSGVQDSVLYEFVDVLYENGAQDYFDALAVHPYCGPNPPEYPYANSWPSGFWMIQDWRDYMVSRGDGHKKIWITEFGWRIEESSEQEQADYLTTALTMAQEWGYIEAAIIYCWMDGGGGQYGIVKETYSPPYTHENFCKPSFFAFKDFTSGNGA